MPTTYEPIATQTLVSGAATITFSSIPATYTDLRLVLVATGGAGGVFVGLRFNGDTGSNYSHTYLRGSGSAASSSRETSATRLLIMSAAVSLSSTLPALSTTDIFSYAGSTFKTSLTQGSIDQNGGGDVTSFVNLWRSTSAINSLTILGLNDDFLTGTTATLYGIKNA
jgi:hypothetical protein